MAKSRDNVHTSKSQYHEEKGEPKRGVEPEFGLATDTDLYGTVVVVVGFFCRYSATSGNPTLN